MTPMPFDSPWLTGLLSAILGGVGSGLYLRRRISRDNTEIVRDQAEAGLISRLQARCDAALAEAEEAREQLTADAKRIAQLSSDYEHARREIGRLIRIIRKRTSGLPQVVQDQLEQIETNFGEFNSRGGAT